MYEAGFGRSTFVTAFTQSGIPASVAEKMIERMKGCLPEWKALIDRSFLPEGMKAAYRELLNRRCEEL
jgi:serine/threonine-protein kinase HipA